MKRIYILLGGFFGPDGWVTSAGFLGLANQLKPLGLVKTYTWDRYSEPIYDHPEDTPDKIIVIGYSGGGSRATWLANDRTKPRIDLMVLYDPSPRWQMKGLEGTNVKSCWQYVNSSPMFFGLGGGRTTGPMVKTRNIAQQHALVQSNQTLHDVTIALIKEMK